MNSYVALLRGINVGGNTKVPMAELRSMVESLGYEDVRTYVQSGNVLFRSPSTSEVEIVQALEAGIAETFDLRIPVVLRTADELAAVSESHPYLVEEPSPTKLHVMFLGDIPEAEAVAILDPDRSPPDRFRVIGREIYLHFPNGAGRSKLTIDYFERRLNTRATARNWNTVTKLLTMMTDAG